jgi:hypothetical protein
MPPERRPPQPPKETRMFRNVPMQAIADVLQTLPIPITITQMLDEQQETVFYRYQVGVTTPDDPVGLRMGSTRHFLDAVKFSLEAIMGSQEKPGDAGRFADTRAKNQAPSPTDEWIVPEVEGGECSDAQAAALGLPYQHRVTHETISQWTERTPHYHPDVASQAGNMEEREEQELTHVLRNLPIAVNIWKRDDGYIWQCFEQSGISEDFAGGVREGLHSLVGQLMREQQGRRGTVRTFGDVLYQTDDGYTERIIADTSRARVVMCESQGSIKLFRVEWTEPDGYLPHKAVYTLRDAMDAFQAVMHPEQQGNR